MTETTNLIRKKKALKTGFKKQFKGKCRICGKLGHKGTDCWTLDSNKEKRPTGYNDKNDGNRNYNFNGNCNYCNKKGHKEADCRAKQQDNANNVLRGIAYNSSNKGKSEILTIVRPQKVQKIVRQKRRTLRWRMTKKYLSTM